MSRPAVPTVLLLNPLDPEHREQIASHSTLIYAPTSAERQVAIAQRGAEVDAVLTIGPIGLTAEEMAVMPKLGLVCTLGVGYERVDVAAARARGIALANGAGANASVVADHAMALVLACVRQLLAADRACRTHVDRDSIPVHPQLTGKRLGVVGLGDIGVRIARRAAAFEMPVGYHTRRPRPEEPAYRHFDNVMALAEWCDVLVLAAPGGPATHHMVNADVLAALGPRGYLVNIARGSLVDTAALNRALRDGTIAGAGLDVYESEPEPPLALLDLTDNLVLSPHVAGRSPEAVQATVDRFLANLEGHLSGRGVVSPI
jgi:lactate dehydrogenase-like 2-hydroxyacid dehydrogenase